MECKNYLGNRYKVFLAGVGAYVQFSAPCESKILHFRKNPPTHLPQKPLGALALREPLNQSKLQLLEVSLMLEVGKLPPFCTL